MKVLPFNIAKPDRSGLVFQEDLGAIFYDKLHQHEEIQVSLIIQGRGTLIVGDTVNEYIEGQVIAIGSRLPHVFKTDPLPGKKSHMLSLFFSVDGFGPGFFELEEFREAELFFKKAGPGFKLKASPELSDLFMGLMCSSQLDRFISLLRILRILSKSRSQPLSSYVNPKSYSIKEGKRMQDIMAFTTSNYQRPITLDDVAEVAAMTKESLCKYFKRRTNKTYTRFLNEFRVEQACKLLRSERDLPVAEIADRSGFNNLSNFNRQFKGIKGQTPTEFIKQI